MRISRNLFLIIIGMIVLVAGFFVRKHFYYPITNKVNSGETIIALGDSLTFGTGAGRGEDWPALISEQCGCTIINKGVPGETTQDALARLDRDVLSLNPSIVIVALGGNDILQRLPRESIFENLRVIIDRIHTSGAMVILVGLNGFPLAGSLGSGYKSVARETGSLLVPNILGGIMTDPKLKSDQIHPNAAGYKIMADRIYDKLEPYL